MKPNTETSNSRAVETRIHVRYAETDQMGVVYYANYLVWFEVGRAAYCRQCGFNYSDMEKQYGAYLFVAESYCRYKAPAHTEEEIIIRTRIGDLNRRVVKFYYEIVRAADERLLAEGYTTHVVSANNGKPRSFPEECLKLLVKSLKTELD